MNINYPQVCWQQIFQAGTNCCFLQLLKICWWVSGNRLSQQSWEPPPAPHLQLAVHLLERGAQRSLHVRSLWTLSPSLYPLLSSISLPFHPLIGVPEPRRGGERGHGVKVFSSLDLGACWERLGERMAALEQGLGVKILILLKNSWFEFLLTSLSPPSPHKSREMKNLFRGEPVK